MKTIIRPFLLASLALLAALAVAACGGDDSSSSSSSGSSTGSSSASSSKVLQSDPANASKGTITVGSKNFTEQYILGEIYAQSLEALGFKTRKQLDLGSEQIAYKALRGGDIDAYPEYTGTALTSFFDVKTADVPRDPQQAYELAKREYAAQGITALPITPFENTFRVTTTAQQAQQLGNPQTLSELFAGEGKNLSISGFPECRQRTDCLLGLRDQYGYEGEFVSSQGKFEDLENDTSDLTFAFSTDAQLLQEDKYADFEDDKRLFPPYQISLGVREDTARRLGQPAIDALVRVQEGLTEEAMRELNRRVELDKQEPEAVAAAYLSESGYVQ